MLTFGSHSMADFLLNWVAHVHRLAEPLFLVGALDPKLAALCADRAIPAATISDASLNSMGASKLSSASSHRYYRYAPGTFLRMGLIKQIIIVQMIRAGYDAMVSDVDVVWLRPPWPLVGYGSVEAGGRAARGAPPPASNHSVRPSARLLAMADVILSVDQVQQYMDSDKHRWHIDSELNTGVAFFRNTPGALAVLAEWKEAMAKAIARNNPNHDQFWLNEVLRPRKFVNLKSDAAGRAGWFAPAAAALRAAAEAAGAPRVGLPASADDFDAASPELRAIFLFERRFGEPKERVALGTFPIAEVSNGHTYFVQKLHQIVGVAPTCVHTTYQYGDATTYAYGKRERLRDEHLWLIDPPSRYDGNFLVLKTAPARMLTARTAELLDPRVTDPSHCVRSHLKLSALQRQWLQDGFLLAAALKRTLVLPRLWCMLDRFWTILNHCLIGPRVEMPQPFVCPLDHSYNLPNMAYELDFREHSFLDNPAAPPSLLASAATLRIGDAPPATPTPDPARADRAGPFVSVAAGSTFAQAAATVAASAASGSRILEVDASDLSNLCRCLAGAPTLHALGRKLPRLLASDYHYCDTTDNPYFVECKSHGRPGCRKHPVYLMNVSRGWQAPPAVPLDDCGPNAANGATGTARCPAYEIPQRHITEGVIGATSV